MRRFIFVLMIALLPLRGWMGEAMATETASINFIATQVINTPANANLVAENSMSDCDLHKSKTANNTSDTTNTTAKSSCTHCQACHATGLVSTVQIISSYKVHYAQPLAQVSQYASPSIALSQKPPIL